MNHFLYVAVLAALLPMLMLRDFTPANELRYLNVWNKNFGSHATNIAKLRHFGAQQTETEQRHVNGNRSPS